MAKHKKLLLFDGSSLAFRAFYAMSNIENFTNAVGLHTNALYTFHMMLKHMLETEAPTHALVAWDAGKTTFRNALYDEYKGGRKSAPEEFQEQRPYFNPLLDAFGIKHYELINYEADDIIGTLAKAGEAEGYEVLIVSGDRDLIQLASANTTVAINRKGVTDMTRYTEASMLAEMGIRPEQMVDVKGLMGDTSDNYPGVSGIGEKTALQLIQTFCSVEGVYENIDQVTGKKRRENLERDKAQAFLSKKLARIIQDAPIEIDLSDTEIKPIDYDKLRAFYREMDFRKFMAELPAGECESMNVAKEHLPQLTASYSEDEEILAQFIEEAKPKVMYIERFDRNYHVANIEVLALAGETTLLAFPVSLAIDSPSFKKWLGSENDKILFDKKANRILLDRLNLPLAGVKDDVLIMAYVLNGRDYTHDVVQLALDFDFGSLKSDEEVYGKGKKQALPQDDSSLLAHLSQKCALIMALPKILKQKLKSQSQWALYQKMELPLADVLSDMERLGISVQTATLDVMHEEIQERIDQVALEIYQRAGGEFNLNSTQQLSEVLFEKLALKGGKKTKSGKYSTAQAELEKLIGQDPIIEAILTYRQLAKLQSTYVEGLKEFIMADGKIHTRFTQTLTATGRLSSQDPNLQNIPIRTEEGRRIRQAFVPSQPDWLLYSYDYSQIELRVLAHISGDQQLQAAFIEGLDIHKATASRVFNVDQKDVTTNQRRDAKAVNFGIVYGISDYGLSQNLGISRFKAKDFIDNYFASFPAVKVYMDEIVDLAREKGYVETLFNRRRYLPDLQASNYNLRSFAERTAMNTPIQGTAADIIKRAMLLMANALEQENLKTRMLLQVHDELILEGPKEERMILEKLVPEMMGKAADLSVPLIVEGACGENWYEAK